MAGNTQKALAGNPDAYYFENYEHRFGVVYVVLGLLMTTRGNEMETIAKGQEDEAGRKVSIPQGPSVRGHKRYHAAAAKDVRAPRCASPEGGYHGRFPAAGEWALAVYRDPFPRPDDRQVPRR